MVKIFKSFICASTAIFCPDAMFILLIKILLFFDRFEKNFILVVAVAAIGGSVIYLTYKLHLFCKSKVTISQYLLYKTFASFFIAIFIFSYALIFHYQ